MTATAVSVSSEELADLEALALEVATAAAHLIRDERPARLGASTKSSRTDVVTVMDQRAQDLLLELLGSARAQDGILGEEEGGVEGTSGLTWVIDPIDGTANYLYEIPAYAVSVAVVEGDPAGPGPWRPLAGAVVNGATLESFTARRGHGAQVTTPGSCPRSLRANAETDLGLALLATGFGYSPRARARQAGLLVELLPRVRDIRRFGSAALDLCRLAAGEVDAYYESGLNAWDFAAGWLIAAEAGCVVGGPVAGAAPHKDLLWAAAPGLATEFGEVIRELAARHTDRGD